MTDLPFLQPFVLGHEPVEPVRAGGLDLYLPTAGDVTGAIVRDGSTQTLHPADNPAVRGLVWRPTANQAGTTGAFFSTSTFGSGRVAIWGDSSPIDDGTGQAGNTLFNGWNDPAGTDAALALNATAWLAGTGTTTPPPPGNCTAPGPKLGNTGFETGTAAPWTATAAVVSNDPAEPAHAGTWKAWLDGYGTAHTDTLRQTATVPAGCSATLSFWLHVDTAETSTTTAFDTLTVSTAAGPLATFSNLNHNAGFSQHTVAVPGTGSIALTFTGVEGTKLQTSFVVDDVTLTAS